MSTPSVSPGSPAPSLTRAQWLICIIAAIGFAFDIYELLMMPLIANDALSELLQVERNSPEIREWVGIIFWSSAMAGGVFGLLGGYLTDFFGRRKVLVFSILLYAFSAFAAGFSRTIHELLILRCLTFIGVCIEFVAAVAWLAELFPNPQQREKVLGYTQAFSSLGGLLVAGASALCVNYANSLPAIYEAHSAWRYTLISGVIPALPLIVLRPFLPESPVWHQKKLAGTLRRPSFGALFQPQYLRTTVVTTILFACSYGVAFGAIQLTPSIMIQGLEGFKPGVRESIQGVQEVGGLCGRFLLAFLAVRILSRGKLLRVFLIPGLFLVPLVFFYPARHSLDWLYPGMFIAGFFTVAQFSFWGNYLPRVYPVHLRGTGESFAANVGGRMLGTSAAYLNTSILAPMMGGAGKPGQVALAATCIALGCYALALLLSFKLPEPASEDLPE